jgi:transcriptional activator of cad operon
MPNPSSPPNDLDDLAPIALRIGDWCVDPRAGQISRAGESVRVEARSMRLLLCLAARAGSVVSIGELLDHVWSGVIVTPDSVYQAITSLRRQLGDDPKRPAYIATVPRLGYRMVATVSPWSDQPMPPETPAPGSPIALEDVASSKPHRSIAFRIGVALILALSIAAMVYLKMATPAQQPTPSIAVLPFLDLTTQAMNEEYVADGMTEELIGDLSKLPGFRVPGPTSSFYFKRKTLPVAEIAKKLDVVYVLDGSIRESDGTVRVAARLIRAQDGYVAWTESYDRPQGDILKIQKDIAAEMTRSIRAAIVKPSTTR